MKLGTIRKAGLTNLQTACLLGACTIGLACLLLVLMPPWTDSTGEVIVYTALDEEFSRPVFEEFTRQTGIKVLGKFDTESTKTVGLTQAILAEKHRPRCDVFWNNEIVNTLRLEEAGLLTSYPTDAAKHFPAQFRSSIATWHGFAARARVLLVNTDLVPEDQRPTSLMDLVDPRWRGQVGFAKPLAGTTATHAACLFSEWGEEKAKDFLRQLKVNARVMAGNKQVAQAVAKGELSFGLTDTDDAIIEREANWPVAIVFPDQGEGEMGTLFIPNTVAIIKDSAHGPESKALVDFLLSRQVERMLAEGPSAQIPLNFEAAVRSRVEPKQKLRTMEVDFQAATEQWDTAVSFLRDLFATAD